MHIHGIPTIGTKFGFSAKPDEPNPRRLTVNSSSQPDSDLRFVRRQVVTLQRAFRRATVPSEPESSTVESRASNSHLLPGELVPLPTLQPSATVNANGEAYVADIEHAINSLFDDSQLIAKPGPLLKVLRESIRAAVTSVFNNRGPGFVPPFRFGFHFPDEQQFPVGLVTEMGASPADPPEVTGSVTDFLFGDPGRNKLGFVTELQTKLDDVDAQLSELVGDQGIFLDTFV
jgi:hypothetical protein